MRGGIWHLFLQHIKSRILGYLLLLAVLILGLSLGLAASSGLEQGESGEINVFIDSLLRQLPDGSIDKMAEFKNALLFNGALLLLLWLCGLSIIGFPLALGLIYYKGYSVGFCVGVLLGYKTLPGFIVVMLAILPQHLIILPVLLLAAMETMNFSRYLIQPFREGGNSLHRELGRYSSHFLLLLLGVALGAWLQGYLAPFLLKTFFVIV